MYCNKCGKHIDEDSVFCQFCGSSIADKDTKSKSEGSSKEKTKSKTEKKSKSDLLWEKFVEVYDAEDADREWFNALSSEYIWELFERLSINAFESFIQDNKEEFNKQPYKTIEALKNVYTWVVIGGYKLWLAEALLNKYKKLNKFKFFSLDEFVEEWKKYDFDNEIKALSEEMGIGISKYSDFRFNSFMENAPEAKELSNATIEKLKSSLLVQTLNGYHAGKIENTFRK